MIRRARRTAGAKVPLFGVSLLAVGLLAAEAKARPAIAVLTFGGAGAGSARRALMHRLRSSFKVVDGERLLDACDELGITFGQGPSLARAAQHIGVSAVIGGKLLRRRRLALAVFSAKSGRAIFSGAIRWRNRRSARAAVARLMPVLRRAAVRAPARRAPPRREPPPPERGSPPSDNSLTFEPDPVDRGGNTKPAASDGDETPPDLKFDGDGGNTSDADEPQSRERGSSGDDDGDEDEPDAKVKKGAGASDGAPPRAAAQLGIGIWSRTFTLNQPSANLTHAEYSSGAAFALQLALNARPLSFVSDGFLANIWTRLRFQAALGLSSRIGAAGTEGLSTSMYELLIDFGYHWNFFDTAASPALDLGFGFGVLDFSVDWANQTPQLAAVGYRFLLLGLGAQWPFIRALGGASMSSSIFANLAAELRFDYRVVFSAGEIEGEADVAYGPASVGGLAFTLGLTWRYGAFVSSFGYTYTRFFFTFEQPDSTARPGKRAAFGALDQFNGIALTGGYSF